MSNRVASPAAATAPGAVAGFDVARIREDFPILRRQIRGRPLTYLDNAATTQKPQAVLDALTNYYVTSNANVHRGVHMLSEIATEAHEAAREKVRAFFNAASTREIVFTRNSTEGINLVAQSFGRWRVQAGDEVLITAMEHHSNIVPWQMLCERTGAELAFVPIDDEGLLVEEELDALLARGPKLVAVAHISNVLGTVNDVASIAPGPTRPARSSSSTARRRRRTCRWTSARSAPTSTPGPPTRPTGRRASACCTGAATCSRRCRPSSAAGT